MDFGTTPIRPYDLIGRLESYLQTTLAALAAPETVPADSVFLSMATDADNLVNPPQEVFVTIFPQGAPPWQSVYSGAGETGFDWRIVTKCYARILSDAENRASVTFRDPSYGALSIVGKVLTALQGWTAPVDLAPTESYLREPMRVVAPGFTFAPFKSGMYTWSVATIPWEMKFTALLG